MQAFKNERSYLIIFIKRLVERSKWKGNVKGTEETEDRMRSKKISSQSHQVGHEKARSAHLPRMMERSNNSEET